MIAHKGSSMTAGASPHQVQTNHLVTGLTHTLGGMRSRPMPTCAALRRSPFVQRTAYPPHRHVQNSTCAELEHLGLTALRAMLLDVEHYGSSNMGGYLSHDEPTSLSSASPSEDDDFEDPKIPSGKRKKKKGRCRRRERRRSGEAKAIATSKIVVNLPEFTRKDLNKLTDSFFRFLRMTGRTHAGRMVKWNCPCSVARSSTLRSTRTTYC